MRKLRKHIHSFIFNPVQSFFYVFVMVISVYLLTTPHYLYAVLPSFLILFLLVLSNNQNIGYYIIFFLIPCDSFREFTESLGFLSVSKFLGILLALIVLLKMFIYKEKMPGLTSNLWIWFILFFIINLISAMMSDYVSTSFDNVRQLFTTYVFFGLTIALVSGKEFFKNLPVIIISSVSFVSFLSILGFLFNWEMFAMDTTGANLKRAIGASGDPNEFSAMIIFGIPFLFYYFFSSRSFFWKICFVCLFTISISAIVFTYSRGGSIVLAIVLFLISVGYLRKMKPIHIGVVSGICIIAVILATLLIPDSYWERLKSISLSSQSIRARLTYLRIGFEILIEDTILGSGPGTFKEVYGRSVITRIFSYAGRSDFRYAHNSYLEVLAGTGMLGFIILIIILMITLKNFYTAKKHFSFLHKSDMVSLVSAYRMSFISLMIYFFMLSAFYNKYFWASLAFSQIALRLSLETDKKEPDEHFSYDK